MHNRELNPLSKVLIRRIILVGNGNSASHMPDVPYLKGYEKKQRAVLQARSWLTGEIFRLRDFSLPAGTWVHFDVENNLLEKSGEKHVYLWGFLKSKGKDGAEREREGETFINPDRYK